MKKILFFTVLILLLFFSLAGALEPPNLEGRITDKAGLLSSQEIQSLENIIKNYEKGTSNQIAICIIKSLEGDPLEDFSIRLAEKWKIGQKGKDNGVIILIVKDDKKIRIEVGYGLEGILPDGLCGDIIRNEIAPNFKAGKYFEGLKSGLLAVIKATKGEYKYEEPQDKKYDSSKGRSSTEKEDEVFIGGLFNGIFFIPLLLCLKKIKKINKQKRKDKTKKSTFLWWVLSIIFAIPFLSVLNTIGIVNLSDWISNFIAGLFVGILVPGFFYLVLTSSYTGGGSSSSSSWSSRSSSSGRSSWSSWSSGSSFSGGGGSFGGGGASGGW